MGGRRRGNLNENPMILVNISKKMGSKVSLETSRFVRTHMLAHTDTHTHSATHTHSCTLTHIHTHTYPTHTQV